MKTAVRAYQQNARAESTEATGRRIVDAFLHRLMNHWFDEITLDQVAADAGVTVQTVVRRFGGKDGLLAKAGAEKDWLQSQAELNLSYTTIVAPIDGVVGNRTLRTGQYVQAGTQLMSLVPASGAYVIANFKETQLTNVQAGQPVDIDVDMFPGKPVHGHVDSLAPASGQEFALLPPDNATGNFTKVVQRIPVKIALVASSVELRPGMSVIPRIQTQKRDPVSVSAPPLATHSSVALLTSRN